MTERLTMAVRAAPEFPVASLRLRVLSMDQAQQFLNGARREFCLKHDPRNLKDTITGVQYPVREKGGIL